MRIEIEYDKSIDERMSPIGFAKAVIEFWDIEDVDGVVDEFEEMVEHLQVRLKHWKDEGC